MYNIAMLIVPIPFIYVFYQFGKRLWAISKDPELRGMFLFVLLILGLGTLVYARVEGWSLLDSLYFSVVTLTTIGYGDLAPQTAGGKIFTMVYILMGLGVLAVFISTMAEHALAEQRQKVKDRETRRGENLEPVEPPVDQPPAELPPEDLPPAELPPVA
ncbi:MAG: two pore domain potassium channel family protein [Anaerolineales bacterium]|nr:two pore domain potassium channel family protein [Anaerolineales bacterium]